jgi:hypothetical protein
MALGFIIPLKSRKVSEDWNITSMLLNQTISSIRNQTSKDIEIIVVCHERPILSPENIKLVQFFDCDHELQRKNHIGEITHYKQIDYIQDKTMKITLGLKQMGTNQAINYYMVLDADDLIHKDLAEFVNRQHDPNGYIIKNGYEYFTTRQLIVNRKDMDKICGSTTILHRRHVTLPPVINETTIWKHPWGLFSHADMDLAFANRSHPLSCIPFPAVMYILDHGQNASIEFRGGNIKKIKKSIKLLLKARKPSPELMKFFGIL